MKIANNYVSDQQIESKRWKVINLPAIIFAKVGAALLLDRKRLITQPFLIDNNTMAYIFDSSWGYYFAKILFDQIYLPKLSQTGALPSLNAKDVENLEIKFPTNKQEQTQIGNFFKQLDETIALHKRKLKKFITLKQSFLNAIFCSKNIQLNNQNTFSWEQRKLKDLLTKYEDIVDTPNNGYERLGLKSHAKGIFHSYVEAGKELSTAKMHKIAKDKFILNITFAWEHAVAITDVNDEGKLVSHRFPQFSFEENLKPIFFKYIILDKKFREHLELCSPGGAGRNRVLKIDEMLNYEIKFPCTKEQTQIGSFFKQLDETIALHKRKTMIVWCKDAFLF